MNILFFGDGAWAALSLERLVADGHKVLAVVDRVTPSSPDLEALACSLGLTVLRPPRVNSPEFLQRVAELGPELNVSVSYDQIVRRPLHETAPRGFVNVHAGRLPQYRGRNVINWAIINGASEIGVTAHYIDEGIDTGDIIRQIVLPIGWTDTYGDVLGRVTLVIPDLVAETVGLIARGEAPRLPQPSVAATYFSGRREGDEWLEWSESSRDIYNKIRGITRPGPGARAVLGGERVVIWRAAYDPAWPRYIAVPGEVVGRRPGEGVVVKTGDSTVLLLEVQVGDAAPTVPAWPIGTRFVTTAERLRHLEARVSALEARAGARG